ncbi:MAG: hypothetical protein IKW76_00920 [Clostridia bacterium]|nr:hypothetical protein [Clostridia bacterium]
MKKVVSAVLCFAVLFIVLIPAAFAEDGLQVWMTTYADTDRGFVLELTVDGVTGVSDAFTVRIQKLKKDREQFGYDIAPEQIAVVPYHNEDMDYLEIYLFEFDRKNCDHVRVEGLLTPDGEKTVVERIWSEKLRLNELDHTDDGLFSFVEPYWENDTYSLNTDGVNGMLLLPHEKDVICTPGDRLYFTREGTAAEITPKQLRIDGDALTQNGDGTITAGALGSGTVHAVFSEQISYTWNVRVVTEEELRAISLRAVKSDPLYCMQYYVAAAALLFSFPPLTVLLPAVIPLAVLTAPAAYVALLAWVRFSK